MNKNNILREGDAVCSKKPKDWSIYPYLLSGRIRCLGCGDALCGKSATGASTKVPYYEHANATKRQSGLSKKFFSCKPVRFSAKRAEVLVWEKVEELLSNEKVAMAILAGAKKRFSSNPHEREIKFNLGKSHFEREIFLNQESSLAFYKETKQNVRGSWPSPNIKKAHKNFLVGFSSNTLTSGDHGKD